jgi:hypothetical protein
MSTEDNINKDIHPEEGFLQKHLSKGNISQHHKELLGADIPKDYFTSSKKNILELVKEETPKKQKLIRWAPLRYAVAASIVLVLSVTVWLQYIDRGNEVELNELADDALINSLFIEDTDVETFTNEILVSEVMIKAELSEQDLENTFMNSLFVEDSLIDDYMGKSLLENIVL